MATDGDRHQLGDPISRIAGGDSQAAPSLNETTDPARLTDEELRRQQANLDQIVREAQLRGTPAELVDRAALRLRQLNIEYRRRQASAPQ